MALAVRNEGAKVNSNINVTPMVDVMLVLLIIFMVITPMVQNKVNVDLAKSVDATPMPDADNEDSVVVAITRDGRCFWGKPGSLSRSRSEDHRHAAEQDQQRGLSAVDARANYGVVMEAIDNIRTSGVDTLGLLTEQPNAGAAGSCNNSIPPVWRGFQEPRNLSWHSLLALAADSPPTST